MCIPTYSRIMHKEFIAHTHINFTAECILVKQYFHNVAADKSYFIMNHKHATLQGKYLIEYRSSTLFCHKCSLFSRQHFCKIVDARLLQLAGNHTYVTPLQLWKLVSSQVQLQ